MPDSKLTGLTEVSIPDLLDETYLVDVSDTTDSGAGTSRFLTLQRLFGILASTCQGRLTLTSGNSDPTADVIGATSVYFTPHLGGNLIGLWDGTRVVIYRFTEMTLAIGTVTSGLPYDVFMDYNAGTPQLAKLAWTNGTTRATAVSVQNGFWAKTGTPGHRLLGTFYTTSTTTTEDSAGGTTTQVGGKRFLCNVHNQLPREMYVKDTTDSWTYTTATYRQQNGAAGNKVEFIYSLPGRAEGAYYAYSLSNVPVSHSCGVGVDVTNAYSGVSGATAWGPSIPGQHIAAWSGALAAGYHFLAPIEISTASGTTTWYGDQGGTIFQTAFLAKVTL